MSRLRRWRVMNVGEDNVLAIVDKEGPHGGRVICTFIADTPEHRAFAEAMAEACERGWPSGA